MVGFIIGFGLGWFLSVPVYLYFKQQREKDDSLCESVKEGTYKGGRNPPPPKGAKRPPRAPPGQGCY